MEKVDAVVLAPYNFPFTNCSGGTVKIRPRSSRATLAVALMLAASLFVAACGGDEESSDTTAAAGSGSSGDATAEEVRLGFFPNVTHAPALVGLEEGFFEDQLGDTTLSTSAFNAGPEAVEALFADALDVTYIGPNPAINAFAQSDGEAIRIVSGSTSGGAFLVTSPDITSPEQLKGKSIATPQLGNTQDVALRVWLEEEGLSADTSGGGDVAIVPQANADTLAAFIEGDIDGAWVPEPWATRLIKEGGGKVLVDEATLWPEGRYVTTHIIVRTAFLDEFPGTVKAILEGHQAALGLIESDPEQAQLDTNAQIEALTDSPLPEDVLADSWANLTFTDDPIASSLEQSAKDAEQVGLLDPVDLSGIYDLSIINSLLTEAGEPEVDGL
jgi:NitT/TauT family transport system substrate-binding protein